MMCPTLFIFQIKSFWVGSTDRQSAQWIKTCGFNSAICCWRNTICANARDILLRNAICTLRVRYGNFSCGKIIDISTSCEVIFVIAQNKKSPFKTFKSKVFGHCMERSAHRACMYLKRHTMRFNLFSNWKFLGKGSGRELFSKSPSPIIIPII